MIGLTEDEFKALPPGSIVVFFDHYDQYTGSGGVRLKHAAIKYINSATGGWWQSFTSFYMWIDANFFKVVEYHPNLLPLEVLENFQNRITKAYEHTQHERDDLPHKVPELLWPMEMTKKTLTMRLV